MDSSKISRQLNWQPRHSLSSGLLKTVEWYLQNPTWVEAIRKQQDYQGWLARNYNLRSESK
jgi:dTDP-glucose 4,6-dehydratase